MTTGWFTFAGTNLIYTNGESRDIKTYLTAGFKHEIIDQHEIGG
jgi:hypothetical protein